MFKIKRRFNGSIKNYSNDLYDKYDKEKFEFFFKNKN